MSKTANKDMRSWAEKECDACGNVEEFSRAEPKDFNQPFTCSPCTLSRNAYEEGYQAGLKAGLAEKKRKGIK